MKQHITQKQNCTGVPANLHRKLFSSIKIFLMLFLFGAFFTNISFGQGTVTNNSQWGKNGPATAPASPVNWANGNAQHTNSHFVEGQSVPNRIEISGLTAGVQASITFNINIIQGSTHQHAFDFFTGPNRITETVDPLSDGLTGYGPANKTFMWPIPNAGNTGGALPGFYDQTALKMQCQQTYDASVLGSNDPSRNALWIYNGTINSITYVWENEDGTSTQFAYAKVTYTPSSTKVLFAMGAHIAPEETSAGNCTGWGTGSGATTIGGSPYHFHTQEVCQPLTTCAVQGQADQQMAADAVCQTPTAAVAQGGTITCTTPTTTLDGTASSIGSNYTYNWVPTDGGVIQSGGTTLSPVVSHAGTYTLTVTNTNGNCTATAQTTVNANNTGPTLTSSHTDVVCNGGSTGSVTASVTGGSGSYSYVIAGPTVNTSGATSGVFTGLTQGLYTVTVTANGNGCSNTIQETVGEPTAVTAGRSAGTIACHDGTTTLTASASGGSGTYTYSIDGITYQSGTTFTVSAGTYTVSVKDGNLCPATSAPITIANPTAVTAGRSAGTIACHDGTTTLTASASGGSGTYTYSIDGITYQSGTTFTVSAGTYTVSVKDGNLCPATSAPITIANPTAVTAGRSAGTIACHDGTTTLTASASGGSGTYTYSIDGTTYQSGTTFTVSAGTYTVSVKDGNLCPATSAPITIANPTAVTAGRSAGTIACHDGTTTLTASASGGSGTYTYSIDGITYQSGTTFTVSAGTYTVSVKDGNLCPATSAPITIANPTAVTAGRSAGTIACHDGTTTLTASASGGSGTYTYSIDGITYQSGTTFTVSAGTYTVSVKDGNLCPATSAPITIANPTAVTAGRSAGTIACHDGTTTLTASASGGSGTYTYSIDGITYQSGTTFTVSAGTYTVSVKDGNLCPATSAPITIANPTAVTAGRSAGTIACHDGTTTLTASASGGSGTYTYSIDGITYQSGTTFTVSAGTYTVSVKDGNLCPATSAPITIANPTAVTAGRSAGTIACHDGTTTLTASASGGSGTYTYSIDGITYQSGTTFTVSAGTYTVSVKDGNLCPATSAPITIANPTAVTAGRSAGTIACHDGTTTLTASASGGSGTYTYSIDGITYQSGTTFTVSAGTYTVSVKDGNLCPATSAPITIANPTAVTAGRSAGTIACHDGTTTLTASASGGSGTYTYSIDGITYQSGTTFTVSAGTYTVSVKDGNLCPATSAPITIANPDALNLFLTPTDGTCQGGLMTISADVTGTPFSDIEINIDGGLYTTVASSPVVFNPTTEGNHTITIRRISANTCLVSQTTGVTLPVCQPPGGAFGTYTQGYYGGKGKSCDGVSAASSPVILITHLLQAGGDITLGNTAGSYIKILRTFLGATAAQTAAQTAASATAINSIMPGGSIAGPLKSTTHCDNIAVISPAVIAVNNGCIKPELTGQNRIGNVLLSQTLALTLNSRMGGLDLFPITWNSGADAFFYTQSVTGVCGAYAGVACSNKKITINAAVVNYLHAHNAVYSENIAGLLKLANDLLGGVLIPGGGVPDYSQVNAAIDTFNNAFDEWKFWTGTYNINETPPVGSLASSSVNSVSCGGTPGNSASLTYNTSTGTGLPYKYKIDWNPTVVGLSNTAYATLSSSAININLGDIAAGTYTGILTVKNNNTGCTDVETFRVNVGVCPVIFTKTSPELTFGVKGSSTVSPVVINSNQVAMANPKVAINDAFTFTATAYPNPFTSNIRFTLQSSFTGHGVLEVYNLMGQKIQTVFEGTVFAGKSQVIQYNVPFQNRTSLTYRFTVNNKTVSGKLINASK